MLQVFRITRAHRLFTVAGVILLSALATARTADAQAVTITFDDIPGLTPMWRYTDGTRALEDARLSTQSQLSTGVSFSSPAGYVALVLLGTGHATSGETGIGGVDVPDILKYQAPVVITFTVPNDPSRPAVTDFVSIRGDQDPNLSGAATLEAFDVNGALLGSVTAMDMRGGLTLSLSIPNIHSIRLTQTRSDIAYDDLMFGSLQPAYDPQEPTADAGPDQAVHAGQLVLLDGTGSFDDNTITENLIFAWTLISKPTTSVATLVSAETATPSLVADVSGEYVVTLTVTDADGLQSDPDTVVLSSVNSAPVANAGPDQGTFVGNAIALNGSASYDPDADPVEFSWTLAAPVGSAVTMSGATTATPTFTPDTAGTYTATLTVTDPFGGVSSDSLDIAVITPGQEAANRIVSVLDVCSTLSRAQVTTRGNCIALQNHLTQALAAIERDDLGQARLKLEQAIQRVDGCAHRGGPDGDGPGRDWITDCTPQLALYSALTGAFAAITPEP